MPTYINPEGVNNPWGIRLTDFHKRLAQVTPEEVAHYSDPKGGLEEAQSTFSDISKNTTRTIKSGREMRGGGKPKLFSMDSAKLRANDASGIPQVLNHVQMVQYLEPSDTHGKGCNTCGYETAGCSSACLSESGQLASPAAHIAKEARTSMAWENPAQYLGLLNHGIQTFSRMAQKAGKTPVVRMGGTSESLLHLMQASEAIIAGNPETQFSEYSKINVRDAIRPEQEVPANHPNQFVIPSITEHTSTERMRQFRDQGRNMAVPFNRVPHSTYDPEITMVDRNNDRETFPTLRKPRTELGLGDETDIRVLDTDITGIAGGIVPLGAKSVQKIDASGKGTKKVQDTPFIREVDPNEQYDKLTASTAARVALPTRKGRTSSFRGE